MIPQTLRIPSFTRPVSLREIGLGLGFVAAACVFFKGYIPLSWNLLTPLVILPFLLTAQPRTRHSWEWFVAAVLCWGMSAVLGLKSALFVGFVLALVGLLPYVGLRGGSVFMMGLLLFSPIWSWFDLNISFSLRLMLTRCAGYVLEAAHSGYHIQGNWISGPRGEFSVEKACAGLNLLKYALLAGLLLLALGAKSHKKHIRTAAPFLVLGFLFLLTLFSNLARILFLVAIPLPPETISHHVVGLLYFLGMVLLPALLLVWKFPEWFFKTSIANNQHTAVSTPKPYWAWLLLLAFVGSGFATVNHSRKTAVPPTLLSRWDGFTAEGTVNGVYKFTAPGLLVWVKPLEGFYSAEHSPLGCWRGSGYTFQETGLDYVNGQAYPRGTLQTDTETLYTAWWFEGEQTRTGDAMAWRKHALFTGESFCLVNVTSDNEALLDETIQHLWK